MAPNHPDKLGKRFPISLLVFATLLHSIVVLSTAVRAEQNFKIEEIAPGVFVHAGRYELFMPDNAGDVSNVGFVVGDDAVAVIDTGGSPRIGTALLQAIRARTDLPIKYVINTHMHPDHVFGNVVFEAESPTFVGHRKLPRALAARAERYLAINKELLGDEAFDGTRIIVPTLLVEDETVLDLGGRSLVVQAQKTAHTDNDVTVFDTKTGTLFLGDLLFVKHTPALDGSIRGWLKLMTDLDQRTDVARVVPGHGPASMTWAKASGPQRRYLKTIADEVRALIKEGRTLSEATSTVGLSEKDAWLLFTEYHARNVTAAFAELEWE